MPTFPNEQSKSQGTGIGVTFNPNIPRVTSLNGFLLLKNGWVKNGNEYTKGGDKIVYNGTYWILNGRKVEFFEDIETKNSDTRPE